MNVRQALVAVLLVVPGIALSAQSGRAPENAWVGGREYTPALQWAQATGLDARWLKRDEVLQLGNRAINMVLKAESREASVNGVQVWLSLPVTRRAGNLWVSQLDVRKTLLPLVAPLRNRPGRKAMSVCIDPGHGGRDPGNHAGSSQEKKLTLLLAKELREMLLRAGVKTMLTRSSDRFIELPGRIGYANRRQADVFACLHFNAAINSRATAQGAEVYCLTPAGANSTNSQRDSGGGDWCVGNGNDARNLLLAYHIQRALTRGAGLEDRGVRRARFAVLRDAAMPAVLVEAGFMSHPAEGKKILTTQHRRQLARAIAEGILAYGREVQK